MPGLPATPWLQPADPAAHFMHAYQTGAQISEANARLQAQADQTAVELEVRQREHQQKSLMEQQQLEIEKAMKQSQLGLEQQKLKDAEQMNQMKIQSAARQLQEQKAYEQEVASGVDQYTAMSRHPGMIASGAGYGASLRAAQAHAQATAPESMVAADPDTGIPAHINRGGRPYFPPGAGKASALDPQTALQGRALESAYGKALYDLTTAQQGGKKSAIQKAQASADALRSQIEQLGKPAQASAPTRSAHEVIRVTKDGKRAVFDADTKKFLRYAE